MVIFVHGSGPHDRDETIGENKPFKDIAEYLLNNGIASYRYDKRTYSHPEAFTEKSTVEEETINDAVNAALYFKNNADYKGYQIIILGHSRGAYMMPKIAEKAQVSKYVLWRGMRDRCKTCLLSNMNTFIRLTRLKFQLKLFRKLKSRLLFKLIPI